MPRIARILALILVVALAAVPAARLNAQDPGPGPYTEVRTLGRGMVRSAAWSPKGDVMTDGRNEVIAVGGVVGIWLYAPDLSDVGLLKGHTKAVYGLAFSPDGSQLASVSHDMTVRVWDVAPQQELFTLEGHTGLTVAVAWHPTESLIASGAYDGTIRFWDPATGAALRQIDTGSWVNALAFSPDGSRIASAQEDGTVRLWDAATGEPDAVLHGHTDVATSVAWGADGGTVISTGRDAQAITWDAASGDVTHVEDITLEPPSGTATSPDGGQQVVAAWDGYVTVRGVSSGAEVAARPEHMDWITAVEWEADGTIRCAALDGVVRTWDASGAFLGAEKGSLPAGPAAILRPDGARQATASPAGVTITDAASGDVIAVLPGQALTAAWSPDGSQLVVAMMNGTMKIWGEA
ncbi:WD40 repeat domain-containing protein [Aggregatilinea lenta]|uniref:WD40 repeat domain-containing protein n=1 Tax=Aggregatilinea lenta TaxID=913108 RepID=UPI000E5ACABA|nr:WD40 repeat domain-containing protein [Aggregatilinea lenta]